MAALAFDVYGTLVDPLGMTHALKPRVGAAAGQVAAWWRQRQLEYTFRLAAMGRYEDFEVVTRHALRDTLAATGQTLDLSQQDALLAQYRHLPAYADVRPGLERLRAAGHVLAVLSNGTPGMLNALLDASGLRGSFGGVISVDEVRTYKPSPEVYRHAARRLGRPIEEVWLVSSNPFDAIGARAAGMAAVWVNRIGATFDSLGQPPSLAVPDLLALADALGPSAPG
jgi:2-haloacid dehalogenase